MKIAYFTNTVQLFPLGNYRHLLSEEEKAENYKLKFPTGYNFLNHHLFTDNAWEMTNFIASTIF